MASALESRVVYTHNAVVAKFCLIYLLCMTYKSTKKRRIANAHLIQTVGIIDITILINY